MSIYELAYEFIEKTNHPLFITGKAGTGKTTFLHNLRKHANKQMAVVAPTGVAAINAGGVTIHSFFQLPFKPFLPTIEGESGLIGSLKMNSARRKVIRELELLVIDEISMVRADVLDAIDTVLRHVRHKRNEPFGGIQMVFIGDMFQLSPVARGEEWNIISSFYSGIFFFHSKVVEKQQPVYIEFNKIFRQSDDDFIELLNQVRNDNLSDKSLNLLQSRYNPSFRPESDDPHITLTTHNAIADNINIEELSKLKGKSKSFKAEIKGQFYESSFPSDELLELKEGARVMFVKNDTEQPRRFYNGKIGTITLFDENEDVIYVKPDDPDEEVIAVTKTSWENVKYSTNEKTLQVEEEVIGIFTQYPLRLAWAITIHKSQGLTFDKVVIDAGASFAPGQVYVALSRCRTLEGITLLSKINRFSIRNDSQVVVFSSQQSNEDILMAKLGQAEQQYRMQLLIDLFDFSSVLYISKMWHKDIIDLQSSFNEQTLPFIRKVISQLSDIDDISVKFQNQLRSIFQTLSQVDESFLSKRIEAANIFFNEKIESLIEILYESPALTDSRTNAKKYDEVLEEIFSVISHKIFMINGIVGNVSVEKYFELRNNFHLSNFTISSHSSKVAGSKKLKSEHPHLLGDLIKLRNALAERDKVHVHIVATTDTLIEMSNYLPDNNKKLKRISGIGTKRLERYGKEFLEIINNYRENNDIEINEDLPDNKEASKESGNTKGKSARESLRLYNEGESISEIAQSRQLVESTIAGHLASFISTGDIDMYKFVSKEQVEKAINLVDNKPKDISQYAALRDYYSSTELIFLNAFFKNRREKR